VLSWIVDGVRSMMIQSNRKRKRRLIIYCACVGFPTISVVSIVARTQCRILECCGAARCAVPKSLRCDRAASQMKNETPMKNANLVSTRFADSTSPNRKTRRYVSDAGAPSRTVNRVTQSSLGARIAQRKSVRCRTIATAMSAKPCGICCSASFLPFASALPSAKHMCLANTMPNLPASAHAVRRHLRGSSP
jgi:hypothetical protein